MIFGWQGFQLEHPEDWAPVAINGDRREGYVRIAGPGRASLQIRWKKSKSPITSKKLDLYFERLRGDCSRQKLKFHCSIDEDGDRTFYRYTGIHHAHGVLFCDSASERIFFIEAIGSKKDSLLGLLRSCLASFSCDPDGSERWAILGVDVSVPQGLELVQKDLKAGKTSLSLANRKAQVQIDRWGFAEQLVSVHGLQDWAKAVLHCPNAEVSDTGVGLEICDKRLLKPPRIALVKHQVALNQILVVSVSSRDERWMPQWDWLT